MANGEDVVERRLFLEALAIGGKAVALAKSYAAQIEVLEASRDRLQRALAYAIDVLMPCNDTREIVQEIVDGKR